MGTLHHQIRINAPLERVWETLIDLEKVIHYNMNVDSVKCISENKTGIGASRLCHFKGKGFAKERVTAMEEMKSISMEIYESDMPMKYMRWSNSVARENGQTIMTSTMEFKMKFGLIGSLMEALVVKNKFDQALNDLYKRFKEYTEKNAEYALQ